jgi:hypothetical protein
MSGENEINHTGSAPASSDEIASLCVEFSEMPIVEIARHAITYGAALTRQRLLAGITLSSFLDGKEST